MPAGPPAPVERTPFEVASGLMFGGSPLELPSPTAPPRATLEGVIRDALLRGPLTVAFSGGRDSSALLAIAAHVARRDGLTLPVPITRIYPPELHEADEREWQDLVVRHLELPDWLRVEVPADHLDVLGPVARPLVRRFGPLWPPGCHQGAMLLPHAAGTTLLTGEGGDALFGRIRLSTATRLRARRQRVSRAAIRSLRRELGPAATRRRRWRRELSTSTAWRSWLLADASRRALEGVVAESVDEPLTWAHAMRYQLGRRRTTLGATFTRSLAAEASVELRVPFLDPSVVAALAADIHPWGFTSRGDAMQGLVGDLLPDSVIRRSTKASFNEAAFGRYSRAFMTAWDGTTTLDAELAPVRLRRLALGRSVPAGITGALQEAWIDAGAPTLDDHAVERPGTGA